MGASLEHPRLSIERQEATFLKTKRDRVRTIRLRHPACPEGVGTEVGTPRHIRSNYVFWHGEGERYHNVASRLRAAIKALVEHKDPAQRVKRFRVHDLRRRRRSHRRAGGLRDGGALMRVILENLDAADLGPVTVIGRDAWALVELHRAGEAGCTPMTHPGPRWSGYVHKLRKLGLRIETVTESHGGPFAGQHARCVLRSKIRIVGADSSEAAA